MTGGRRGFCALPPGSAGIAYRGRVAGAYRMAYPAMPDKEELELLRNEFAMLQKELEVIERRIKSMEAQKSQQGGQ